MIFQAIEKFSDFSFKRAENFTSRSGWQWRLALILPLIVLFFSFPSYERIDTEFASNWDAVLDQSENPIQNDLKFDPSSHQSKLTFRLTMPLIIRFLGLNVTGVLVLQAFIGILIFYFTTRIFERITKDSVSAFFLTLSFAFILAGKVSFTEIRGIFDGLAIFFMIFAIYFSNPILIFTGVFLASWTDERALIASIFISLFWVWQNKNEVSFKRWINKQTIAVVFGWIAYFGVRIFLTKFYGLKTETVGIGISYVINQTNNVPIGIWSAFEGLWLVIFSAIFILIKSKDYFFVFSYLLSVTLVLFVALAVFDISRSMTFIFPALFVALSIIVKKEDILHFKKIIFFVMVICFIYPVYTTSGVYFIHWQFPLPVQFLRYMFVGL